MEGLFLLGFGFIGIVLAVIWIVLQIVARWKIFEKAGKPGWHSIIPILCDYDEFDICWLGWIGILAAICVGYSSGNATVENPSTLASIAGTVGSVLNAICCYKMSKSFGHGIGYAIGLFFLAPIFKLILGFGSDKYLGKM